MKMLILTAILAVAALGQQTDKIATIYLYYPNGEMETVRMPESGYLVNNGCVHYGDKKDKDNWTTFCGTFKVIKGK